MKRNTAKIITVCVLLALGIAAAIVFGFPLVTVSDNEATNKLALSVLARAPVCALLIFVWIVYFRSRVKRNFVNLLLFSLPCFAVAVANFPFSALITGGAKVVQPALIPLFALDCVLVAAFEEILFRGLLLTSFKRLFIKFRYGKLFALLSSSALFSLVHLINLFYGGGVAETFMQVGYSFALGCMLAALMLLTERISLCVAVHALFNFGGNLISAIGSGSPHDTCFWIVTAVAAVLCAACLIAATLRHKTLKNFHRF